MGCNHKNRSLMLTGTFPRRDKKQIVKEDTLTIYLCNQCGAIRLDSQNIYSYSQGCWSQPYADNKKIKKVLK